MNTLFARLFHRQPQTPARQIRDEWLQWLELGGARPATIKGYRWTTDRLLDRYPELSFDELTDEHILGVIGTLRPNRRQHAASHPSALIGWNTGLEACSTLGWRAHGKP